MAKNIKRYYHAWELRQQGKKLREIAQLMGYKSGESPRRMISHIDFKISSNQPKSAELKKLILKYQKRV
ncbi:MAG: hypothetical protein NTZ55_05305 [Candidatus Roizmanbacteria bacterium]|nr:hypothetical protein [Candidatus Roizmanbacteria bacterium]